MDKYIGLQDVYEYAEEIGGRVNVSFSMSNVLGIYNVWATVNGSALKGPWYFSFDKKRIFNFWSDYPDKLTSEQIKLFNKYNPTLAALKNYGGYPPEDDKQAQDSSPETIWDTRF